MQNKLSEKKKITIRTHEAPLDFVFEFCILQFNGAFLTQSIPQSAPKQSKYEQLQPFISRLEFRLSANITHLGFYTSTVQACKSVLKKPTRDPLMHSNRVTVELFISAISLPALEWSPPWNPPLVPGFVCVESVIQQRSDNHRHDRRRGEKRVHYVVEL